MGRQTLLILLRINFFMKFFYKNEQIVDFKNVQIFCFSPKIDQNMSNSNMPSWVEHPVCRKILVIKRCHSLSVGSFLCSFIILLDLLVLYYYATWVTMLPQKFVPRQKGVTWTPSRWSPGTIFPSAKQSKQEKQNF